ncbi:uncharacterized protein Z520_04797 [Fonsecaea multimorphosa CBS 102226]|uniref:Zn(2)-C6 fungal-type domain-containing protein n=1 Tax=Fonsecaea multimorphosa CBS 102226 TaxID=1442371 RepID=A0A0D2IQH0_9EURO|nr:uncharacterized protein Z520_04797 [Fonsecaea multimorphosa CBS 102226]KIX99221.1 hypothetical protein Z520_04797 [Fonsecaea multimorphosa CBS 102226]OAL25918.1 hypothetical protein AYO22_04545 [Fonsecaea multimorphosa]
MPPRLRETCTACSLRRQKCDRQVPCGRCVKRGVADRCTRQWPGDRYDPSIHRVYPKSRSNKKKRTSTPHALGLTPSSVTDVSDPGPLEGIEAAAAEPQPEPEPDGLDVSWTGGDWANDDPRLQYSFRPFERKQLRRPLASQNRQHAASPSQWVSATGIGFSSSADAQETFLQMLIPGIDHIWRLVDYHELFLLWYHGCYHGPTLRWELHSLLSSQEPSASLVIRGLDLQWLALLFAIMAGSLTCATSRQLEQWGFSKSEAVKLSMQWYKATITCLNQAEYTTNHSIYALHAIATLTMSAHSLGRSSELSVLLGSALKIAQSLGLDQLCHNPTLEQILPATSEEKRHTLLRTEVGRRLWSQLCIQDWMSLPFAESHCINPLHFTTTKPSSRNHLTMDPIPATFPTYISYGNYLFEIAKLMVAHHEAMLRATTPFTKYEQVLDFDVRMRTLATQGMPRYFHVVEPIDPAWPEWVSWARRSLTICFAHKIIMIHRHFIRPSFTNPAYSITRVTCVAAAKTTLNEAKQTDEKNGPIIWVDKAFCVVAGIVLCLDMFHRQSRSDPEYQTHRDLVVECIALLQKFDTSVVAIRGAGLLSALVSELERQPSAPSWPPQNIKMSDIFKSLAVDTTADNGLQSINPQSAAAAGGMDARDNNMPIVPELFPPQAGFCNRFLLKELLDFDTQSRA